jgi:hypothetical protein
MPRDEVISEITQAVEQSLANESGMPGFSENQQNLQSKQEPFTPPANQDARPGAVFADYDDDEPQGGGDASQSKGDSAGSDGDDSSSDHIGAAAGEGDSGTQDQGDAGQAGEEGEGVSQAAVLYAMKAGMAISEARSFDSDGDLMEAVQLHETLAANADDEVPFSDDDGDSSAEKDKLSELISAIDKDELDPTVSKALKAIADEANRRRDELAELRDAQLQVESDIARRDEQNQERWFDDQVKGLGEDFEAILGKGPSSAMLPTSAEYRMRHQIAEQIGILNDGYNARNIAPPPSSTLFDQAARLVLGKEYQAIHEKKVAEGLQSREGQLLNKPDGGRSSSAKPPETETAELLAEKFGMRM